MNTDDLIDPALRSLTTPVYEYGVVAVSRPVAARLLRRNVKWLTRAIVAGRIAATGRVHASIPVAEVERITGQPITCHDYLSAIHQPQRRRGNRREKAFSPDGRRTA